MNSFLDILAQSDAGGGITSYLFTQGVLGVAVVALGIVVIYQQKKIDKKDEKLEALHEARLADNKAHTLDYREMAQNGQEVMMSNSQSNQLLAAKIEVVKDK